MPVNDLLQLEEWIRAGDFSKVAKVLLGLNSKKVARGDLVRFANIANRADHSRLAFRLLNPVIRSEQEAISPPSDLEKIEYAEALRRMGLVNEASEIFAGIDADKFPLVHLRMAFCLFKKWQYAEAIPRLRALIAVSDPNDYLATIAKVNLAAALVHERHDSEALALLQALRKSTLAAQQFLLLGNCLELSAQVLIARREWSAAETVLREAEMIFSKDHNKYSLFVHKWQAIARSLKEGVVHPGLLACRLQAGQNEDWETERDCDLYIGAINRDLPLLQKVYFGTPHANFRRRIFDLAGHKLEIPANYLWQLGESSKPAQIFDLLSASSDDATAQLEPGRLMHQFIALLCSDFYRPVTIGAAFSALFPFEHFAQQGSANRISQLVLRLRHWCEEQSTGFSIAGKGGKYRLQGEPGAIIRIPSEMPTPTPQSILWRKVQGHFSKGSFSRNDVERVSQCSPAGAKRLLRWAVQSGYAQAIGSGSQVRYLIAA